MTSSSLLIIIIIHNFLAVLIDVILLQKYAQKLYGLYKVIGSIHVDKPMVRHFKQK